MEEHELRIVASQLSCPEGEAAVEVGNKMNGLNEFITRQAISALSARKGESIIEIGPGNGLLSLPLLDALGKDGRYLGIELSDAMAAEARQTLSGKGCTVEIFNGHCADIDISKSSVDGIMAVNVLYFIEELADFFKQLLLWMKPDGRVVFGVRSDKALSNLPFTRYGFNIRTTDEIKLTMEQAGFVSVRSFVYEEGTSQFGDIDIPVDSVIIVGKNSDV